jgi:hypothetical protein
MNSHSYAHIIFDRGTENILQKIASSKKLLGKLVVCLQKTEIRSMSIILY